MKLSSLFKVCRCLYVYIDTVKYYDKTLCKELKKDIVYIGYCVETSSFLAWLFVKLFGTYSHKEK